jgi:hypothetical protein
MRLHAIALATLAALSLGAHAQTRPIQEIANEITQSVLAAPSARPLPLAASFLTGEPNGPDHPTPAYQLGPNGWLKRGYHFLPTFHMPAPDREQGLNPPALDDSYYGAALAEARALNLPLVFYGTQWEILLLNRPDALNGDHIWKLINGTKTMMPGSLREAEWFEAGRRWSASAQMRRLMALYPNPPRVIFISNNEAYKLEWGNHYQDPRVMQRDPACFAKTQTTGGNLSENGPGRNCVRAAMAREWKRLYGQLLAGFREGMRGQPWESKMTLVGYDAFGPLNVGRAHNWMDHSLVVMDESSRGRVASWSPWTDIWDGGIVSLYTHSWESAINDYTRASPQAESSNVATQLAAVRATKPAFWFEAGVWDGWEPGKWFYQDKRKQLALSTQVPSPERYAGWVRYVTWATRAPVVREFRGYNNTVAQTDGHFKAVIDATEQVWNDADLKNFWREGELVANDAAIHPYNWWHEPDGGRVQGHRNLLLATPSHPWQPTQYGAEPNNDFGHMLPVFTLALKRGSDYLVYAHAPAGAQQSVRIELPGAFAITENVPVVGRFFVVRGGQVVRRIDPSHRAGDLVFTSVRYEENFLSPGAIGVAWNSRGVVDRITFTPSYDFLREGTPLDMRIIGAVDGQTNFVVPKIDVPYAMGGWVHAYRAGQLVGRGWMALGMGTDRLLTADSGLPHGFSLDVRNGQQSPLKPLSQGVQLAPGTATYLILYAVGTERMAWRIDNSPSRNEGGPEGRVSWKLDYPVRIRITDAAGKTWIRDADWAGNVGPGYEQINLRLAEDNGTPLAGLPIGEHLKVTIEHGSSFKDPKDTSRQGIHISNVGVIAIRK